jgi:ABC-type oligopeptide transport system substrate-binding subunit
VVETSPLTPTRATQWIDYSVANTQASWLLSAATCLKLVDYDEVTGVLHPEAASAMPTVSPDGKTYTFTIRSGQAFAGGPAEPVSASSFKLAIERATSPAMAASMVPVGSALPARPFVEGIAGSADFYSGASPSFSGIQANGNSLTIQLSSPDPTFPEKMAMPFFCATRADTPSTYTGTSAPPPQSGGPYFVSSASSSGSGTPADPYHHDIVLLRNTAYTGDRIQNLGTIRFAEQGSPLAEDYVNNVPAGYVAPSGMSVVAAPTTQVQYLALNTSRVPFNVVEVRRAAAFALDRNALSSVLGWVPTDQFVSPLLPGYQDSDVYPLGGNQQTAQQLLNGAHPSVVLCHQSNAIGQVALNAKAMLEQAGFQVTEIVPPGSYFSYIANPNNCDLAMTGWSPDYPDPSQVLQPLFYGGSPNNISFFSDPNYNQRFLDAPTMSPESARLAEYASLDAQISFDAPAIPIGYGVRRDAFSDRTQCRYLSQALFGYAVNRFCILVAGTAGPGGSVSTGRDATPSAPLQTSVAVPAGGTGGNVTITQGQSDVDQLPVYKLLEQQLEISAPAQTSANPLVLTFEIDGQTLANAGLTIGQVVVYRDGSPTSNCVDPGGSSADPDPCVASRTTDAQGDGVIVLRTSHASTWNFGGMVYSLSGPSGPVDPQPTVNTMKAGRSVPVRFSLGGNHGLDVFASGYPQSVGGECGGSTDVVETTTTNASGLIYDSASGTYTYNWKTSSAWKGQCRTLILKFSDGQELRADFKFN